MEVTYGRQYAVPAERAEEGPPKERTEMHAAQSRRDGDQLADTRNEPADEGRYIAFLAEILLGFLDLLTR